MDSIAQEINLVLLVAFIGLLIHVVRLERQVRAEAIGALRILNDGQKLNHNTEIMILRYRVLLAERIAALSTTPDEDRQKALKEYLDLWENRLTDQLATIISEDEKAILEKRIRLMKLAADDLKEADEDEIEMVTNVVRAIAE